MIVSEKPNYCVTDMRTAYAMSYKIGGNVVVLFLENETNFIGYGIVLEGDLL